MTGGRQARVFAVLVSLILQATPLQADDAGEALVAQRCPGFAAWKKAHPELSEKHRQAQIAIGTPSDLRLRQQLLAMREADQAARDGWVKAGLNGDNSWSAKVIAVDADNLKQFKPIVERQGFPTPAQVGIDGVDAAFLLVQHADRDTAFQSAVLPQLDALYKQGLASGQELALLTDRVLRSQDKPQRYGTQFVSNDDSSAMKLAPIEDIQHVDRRRAGMGLPPLADYACLLSTFYHKPVQLKP